MRQTRGERAHGGERIVVRRGGKAVAAIVPVADLRLLEKLEDERDVALARERLAKKRRTVPWEKVKSKLGVGR